MKWMLIALSLFVVVGCGGRGRALVIKSDPADAEICIKGKAGSEYFSNNKSCVGTTPFDADKVEIVEPGGDRKTVKFKDIESDKESFYVVITHSGYQAQALEVPVWEHSVTLKPLGATAVSSSVVPVAAVSSLAAPVEKGSAKVTSEPTGALVYINNALKGNTPFTYEGPAGTVRLKLELDGFEVLERALEVQPRESIAVNFKLAGKKVGAVEAGKTVPEQTSASPAAHSQ